MEKWSEIESDKTEQLDETSLINTLLPLSLVCQSISSQRIERVMQFMQ